MNTDWAICTDCDDAASAGDDTGDAIWTPELIERLLAIVILWGDWGGDTEDEEEGFLWFDLCVKLPWELDLSNASSVKEKIN